MVPISFFVKCLLSFSSLLLLPTVFASIEIMQEFFPQIEGNLTRLTWAHGVNSKQLLNETLHGDVMMIEADIILGNRIGKSGGPLIPMMGHPPASESDLSLKEFLDAVGTGTVYPPKGVKLDFKSDEVFNASEPILEEFIYKNTHAVEFVPIWLNADIIHGPINSRTRPVDPDLFLRTTMEKFPNTILSIGWTTEMSEDNYIGNYTIDHINSMTAALSRNRITQPVTFPVRAGLAAQSREVLVSLIDTSVPGTTLTIWSHEKDPVNIPKLRCLIKTIGVHRIFLDLPDSIRNQLDLTNVQSVNCTAVDPDTPPITPTPSPSVSTPVLVVGGVLILVLLVLVISLYFWSKNRKDRLSRE